MASSLYNVELSSCPLLPAGCHAGDITSCGRCGYIVNMLYESAVMKQLVCLYVSVLRHCLLHDVRCHGWYTFREPEWENSRL